MSFYGFESIRNLNKRIKKNLNISKPVMNDYEFAQQPLPLPGPLGINHLHEINSSVNHIRTSGNSLWDNDVGYIPPPPKREPIIEHKITEEEDLRNKIQQYRHFIDGWMRMITQLEEKITKKTALVNQAGKDKVGPFNIVGEYIDSNVPFLRDEKLSEIENLRNEWIAVERKETELEKRIRELRRIDFKLDLRLKGKRVSFDVKEIYPLFS